MRKEIFRLVSRAERGDITSRLYNIFIMLISIVSVIPLAFRIIPSKWVTIVNLSEIVCVYILLMDYILHWITHDYKMKKQSILPFFIYPLTPMAIIDLAALLPSIGLLHVSFKMLRLLRLVKLLTYSRSCSHIVKVFRKEGKILFSVLVIAVAYILISAMVMFQNEPESTFRDFFDAVYWAATALTTIGYGDFYPHSDVGKLVSIISSLFGVAVIALPSGIVTAGFVESIQEEHQMKENNDRTPEAEMPEDE